MVSNPTVIGRGQYLAWESNEESHEWFEVALGQLFLLVDGRVADFDASHRRA